MVYVVTLKYESLKYCKNVYPYFENAIGKIKATENEMKCIKSILGVIKELIDEFTARNYVIYSFKEKKRVAFDELLKPVFLFFSVGLLNQETIYIVANDNICIDRHNDDLVWIEHEKNGIVISNDDDGQCLYFSMNVECKKHEWLFEYLQKYNAEIHEANIKNSTSLISAIKEAILVPLFIVLAIIGAIFELLCTKFNAIAKTIIKIFKKRKT